MSFKRSRKTSITPWAVVDHIQPIFTGVIKKPGLKNLNLCVVAILRAKHMRINEVAASLAAAAASAVWKLSKFRNTSGKSNGCSEN